MSRFFGPATQNGIVAPDLDAALGYWTKILGVGPFFRIDNLKNEYFFQGECELPSPNMSIALANWGNLQIELMHPHGASDSTWHQFLNKTGGGLHHISVWSTDYDAHVHLAFDAGLKLECHGKILNGVKYTYFQSEIPGQPLIEISDLTPQYAEIFAHIRYKSLHWDSIDPVRSIV